jgi:transcriptional regulator with XRE-family HTH domain
VIWQIAAPQAGALTERVEIMAAGELPAVARRRLKLALRKAREDKGLTQSQVADAMEWSLSKVMRIESGEVSIALNDLRPLLAHLDIVDEAVVEDLTQAARVSRRRKEEWFDEPRFRDHMTPAMRQLVQYETDATTLRHYCASVVPGWLQIPSYARTILEGWSHELPDEEIAVRMEARAKQREAMLSRKKPPKAMLLLDESVSLRRIGGASVLANQLDDLLRQVKAGRLTIRVVPFLLKNVPYAPFSAYDIVDLTSGSDDEGNAILYREGWLSDGISEVPEVVARYRQHFDTHWSYAEDEATSERLLRERAKLAHDADRSTS